MALEPGTKLGVYEVTAQIGAGGMGEVYRAHDTTLDRDVAIKVLPDAFATDPERLARFEREAKVLASLNHPNIAAIYGLEKSEDTRALILELVEGPTLQDRIAKGPIPLDEALPIARQIAEALEAAHEQGIIHRDLKPANVKVKDDGTVKVLDFGLAKALQPELSDAEAANSPTMTAAATRAGIILGTAAYMSPEQARGSVADRRSDIWALGVVLYEMLTGHQAFGGGTTTDVLAAILERDPNWSALPVVTPARIQDLLHRCLSKERKQRLRDVGDARLAIDETVGELARKRQQATPLGTSAHTRPAIASAIAAALVLIVAMAWMLRTSSEVDVASSGSPVVILMDTPAPAGVYDPDTRRNSGTNADDLNAALRDFPVELHKETVSTTWDREDQILRQRPALILIHRSSFAHSMNVEFGFDDPEPGQEDLARILYGIADGKLMAFLGYVGLGDSETRFVVYTRGFGQESQREAWVSEIEGRFPTLSGRVTALHIPGGEESATFRDPQTVRLIRDLVRGLLDLED